MEVIKFIYNETEVDFDKSSKNLMVNATQMAKIFGKRIDVFLKTDHAQTFMKAFLSTPYGGNKTILSKEDIIKTNKKGGTWMHKILALKFAAWLDPYFELWVFSTIDQILLGYYAEMKEATIEKLKAEKIWKEKRDKLIKENPEIAEVFELELKITNADKKRIKAMKAAVRQLKMDIFDT